MMIALLTRNSSAADARNKTGETPLMYAANLNKMEFVRLLVQFNVSLEYTDHQEMTLLHVACKNGNKELMQVKKTIVYFLIFAVGHVRQKEASIAGLY